MYKIRNITERDAAVLRFLAQNCPPLGVHTHYTYWVVAKYYSEGGYILENDGNPVGYIMTVDAPSAIFIWQIGILSEHRRKGLSQMLIEAVVRYANKVSKNLEVTIAADNVSSYCAFHCFCLKNKITFEKIDNVNIRDLYDTVFKESEIQFRMIISN